MSIREDDRGGTRAIIRGIAARLKASGYAIGGFDACMTGNVLQGSGLSSSAAVEVLFGTIFNFRSDEWVMYFSCSAPVEHQLHKLITAGPSRAAMGLART